MGDFDGHTPGPWWASADAGRVRAGTDGGFNPIGGCGCCDSPWVMGESQSEIEANARLIAAAPDLLAERDRLRAENERLRAENRHMFLALRDLATCDTWPIFSMGTVAQRARRALAEKEAGG